MFSLNRYCQMAFQSNYTKRYILSPYTMVRFPFVGSPSGCCEGSRLLRAGGVGRCRKRWAEVCVGILHWVEWQTGG